MQPRPTVLFVDFLMVSGSCTGLISQLTAMRRNHIPCRVVVVGSTGSVLDAAQHPLSYRFYGTNTARDLTRWRTEPWQTVRDFLRTLLFVWRVVRMEHPSIIHCNHYIWSIYANPVAMALRIPIVIHLKDTWRLTPSPAHVLMTMNPRAWYIAVSSYVRNQFVRKYHVRSSRMVKIFDGIDAAVFSPSPSHVKKRTILMVSRVTPERDIEMFIQIAFLLRKTFPHLGFVHIGYYARDVDARYFASLRTMVKAHGLSLCFRFIPYQTSAKKMAAYYRSAWASVVPARQFALPNVAIEALLCGTPVVAFRTGGNAEIVSHGETGYLVDTQDPRAYVRWLRQILSHPSLRARLSRQGRRDAMKFSNEAQLIRILELYRRMDPGWTA